MQTLTGQSTSRRRWAGWIGTGATALVAATTIGSAAGAATAPSTPGSGISGSVAALSSSSMEVQNPNTGQTTVNWTATTQFSKTVSEAVSSLAAGDCVSVTGTASKSSKTTIAARNITLFAPSSTGACTGPSRAGTRTSTRGGGFGFPPGGTRPSLPTGSQRRFPGGIPGLASLAIASGKLTGVTGSTFSVSGTVFSPGSVARPTKSNSSKRPVAPKTQSLKITTSGSTTLTTTQSATAGDLAVGDCVSTFGSTASNGAVTATTVRITSTGGTSCTGAFGRGSFFPGGGGFGRGAAGGGSA